MKKKHILWVTIISLVLILAIYINNLFGILSLDDPYDHPNPSWQPTREGFLIDPETILKSLENGETDVFSPNLQQVDGEKPTVLFAKPISWTQGEYFIIAEAVNKLVWNDTLDDWNLYEMDFFLECQDNPSGFERSFMTFFKTIPDDSKGYTVRDFSIEPKYKYVGLRGGANYSRPLFGWKSIGLTNLKINADDALRIAEEYGGRNTRLELNNDCRIRLFLMPEMYTGWQIWYEADGLPKFKIMIDPLTGKIIK